MTRRVWICKILSKEAFSVAKVTIRVLRKVKRLIHMIRVDNEK